MRIKFLLFLFIQLFTLLIYAQTRPFQNRIGYFDYEAIPYLQVVDSSGNHYVLGHFTGLLTNSGVTVSTKGDKDIYIVKYNAQNEFQWMKSFGSAAIDQARSMSCDKDGNIYVTGQFMGNTFYASEKNELNVLTGYQQSRFLFKLNSSGETLWAKKFSATNAASDATSQVFNDHNGRLYFILSNRANGVVNSWNYNDSIISNPQKQYLNVPRWLLARVEPETGNLKWVDYIANPSIGGNLITYVKISKPQVDSKNNILFSVTYDGTNVEPVYIFGQYAAVNPRVNNVLVKIDSSGAVKKIRDLGANNNSFSSYSDFAINANDEPVLIDKKGLINYDGFYRDFAANNTFNIVRIFDTAFVLKSVVKLGDQFINSLLFDKENRLLIMGYVGMAQPGETEKIVYVDSVNSKSIKVDGSLLTGYYRYDQNFKFDTLFIDRKFLSTAGIQGPTPNSLTFSSKGDIVITNAQVAGNFGLINNAVIRYNKNFEPVNINYGKYNDMPEVINGIEEDSSGSIYVSGFMNQRADFESASGTTIVNIPIENSSDFFIAKYNLDNKLSWIRQFWKNGRESGPPLKIGKDGIYTILSSSSADNWNLDSTQLSIDGKMVLLKLGFDGKIIWTKKLPDQTSGISYSALNILKNGNLIIQGILNNSETIDNQQITKLGNKRNILLMTFSPINGDFINYNVYAFTNESLGQIGGLTSSFHEDNNGNLYFGLTASILNTSQNKFTELYSRKQNKIGFNHIWVTQSGLLKLDSTLEIQKFKTFRSYFYLGHIGGIDTTILFSAYAKGPSFNYDTIGGNLVNIPLQSYSTNSHFVNFTGLLDTQLNIKSLSKLDTTTVESAIDINSRKFYVDKKRQEIYESISFVGSTKIDSTDNRITSVGSKDLLFLKYDSTGKLMGGERLGTPQTDNFISALASSGGLIFSTQTVNPQYQSQFLKMKNSYQFVQNSINRIEEISTDNIMSFSNSSSNSNTVNPDALSPDNYVSKKLSMLEIGRSPDTSIVSTGSLTLCQGENSFITINNATNIKWKKDGIFLSEETNDSLVINKSGTYKAIIRTAEGREDSTRAVFVNFYSKPSSPTVSASALCVGTTSTALTATAATGNTLKWYGTSATGGTGSGTAPTPSTSAAGVTTYYVSQVNGDGCESDRAALAFTVNPKPSAPTVSASAICVGTTSTALTATAATGNTLKWYGTSATGGTGSGTAPTPSTSAAGVTTYYVSQVNGDGCESDRAALAFTVNPKPSSPTVSASALCVGTTSTALTATAATGNTLKWYGTSATGGTGSGTAPTPSTSAAGVTTYYVSQVNGDGCESDRAALAFTVNPKPSSPTVSASALCVGTTSTSLTATAATGNTLKWYGTSATGGTGSGTAPTPSTSTAGVTTYYVSQVNGDGCESDRAALTFTVNPKPAAPTVSNLSVCIGGVVPSFNATAATGNTLKWYGTSATGGSGSATPPSISSSTVGVTTYYVSQISSFGCESDRASINYTVNALPEKTSISWNGSELSVPASYAGYQWKLNNTPVLGANSNIHKPLNPGSYFVVIKNSAGCTDSTGVFEIIVTSFNRLNSEVEQIKVYPNPVISKATILLGKNPVKPVSIKLYTIQGREINKWTTMQRRTDVELGNIPNGTYLIIVDDGKNRFKVELIKQ